MCACEYSYMNILSMYLKTIEPYKQTHHQNNFLVSLYNVSRRASVIL